MGPRMSQMAGDGNGDDHLEDGEMAPEPCDPNMPRLRGGEAATYGFGAYTGSTFSNAFGRVPLRGAQGHDESDFYEVPPAEFYAARAGRSQHGPASSQRAPAPRQFDFNDQAQPNPWQGAMPQPRRPEPDYVPEVTLLCLYLCKC